MTTKQTHEYKKNTNTNAWKQPKKRNQLKKQNSFQKYSPNVLYNT